MSAWYDNKSVGNQLTPQEWNDHTIDQLTRPRIQPYSYLIYQDASNTIYAQNGTTGIVDYYGSDASTVIQNAINALGDGSDTQRYVYVKIGSVNITSTINIKSNLIFDCAGSIFNVDNLNGQSVIGTTNTNLKNVDLRNIHIEASFLKDLTVPAINIIGLDDAENLKFRDIYIRNVRSGCINLWLKFLSSGTIRNVTFNNIILFDVGSPYIYLNEFNSSRLDKMWNVEIRNVYQNDINYYPILFSETNYVAPGIWISGCNGLNIENIRTTKATDGQTISINGTKNFRINNVYCINNHDYNVNISDRTENGSVENIYSILPNSYYYGAVFISTNYFDMTPSINNISIRNIYSYRGGNLWAPIFIYTAPDYSKRASIENITFENIKIEDSTHPQGDVGAIRFYAASGEIKNIYMKNITIDKTKNAGIYFGFGGDNISHIEVDNFRLLDIATNPIHAGLKNGILFDYANTSDVKIGNGTFSNPTNIGQMNAGVAIFADSNVNINSKANKISVDTNSFNLGTGINALSLYGNSLSNIISPSYNVIV